MNSRVCAFLALSKFSISSVTQALRTVGNITPHYHRFYSLLHSKYGKSTFNLPHQMLDAPAQLNWYRSRSTESLTNATSSIKRDQSNAAKSLHTAVESATESGKRREKSASIGGVQLLDSFMDVEKLKEHPPNEIEMLWRARHQDAGDLICATIPADVYSNMEKVAQKYPMFVLPLPREDQGVEIFFVQWSFPHKSVSHLIMTSLIEFKAKGEFAIPQLALSHHKELATDKKIVLMRGHIDNIRNLSLAQAQLLAMTLQKFYNIDPQTDFGDKRLQILNQFITNDPKFDIQKVIDEADSLI